MKIETVNEVVWAAKKVSGFIAETAKETRDEWVRDWLTECADAIRGDAEVFSANYRL